MKRITVLTALAAVIAALCASPAWAAWNFVHITDIHVASGCDQGEYDSEGKNFAAMVAHIRSLSPTPAFVVASGDIVNHGIALIRNAGTMVADDATYSALTKSLYQNTTTKQWYLKNSSGGNSGIPIYFTPGNHDPRDPTHLPGYSYAGYDKYMPKITSGALFYGTGDAARDYYFFQGNAMIICLNSGQDYFPTYTGDMFTPEGVGLTNAQMDWLESICTSNASKYPKIIALHHPIVDKGTGTNFDGTPFDNGTWDYKIENAGDGCITQNIARFKTTCTNKAIAVVLSGHLHQNIVLDKDANVIDRNYIRSDAPTRYVQSAECLNGAYRVITVDPANTNLYSSVSVGDRALNANLLPIAGFKAPASGSYLTPGGIYTFKVNAIDNTGIDKVEFYWNGVKISTVYAKPYATNFSIPNGTKSTVADLRAKVYGKGGAADTNWIRASVNNAQASDTYYDRLNVGSSAYVNCPKCKGVMTATLSNVQVGGNGKRQAVLSTSCGCGGWTRYIDVETAFRLTGSGTQFDLFAYPARIFDAGGLRCADIMIAPYQYPTLDIVFPVAGQQTNKCEVRLAANYSGNGVGWNNATAGAPNIAGAFKTINWTYNNTGATGTTYSDYFTWDMSSPANTDPRTLTVALRDLFGTPVVSKSITVVYNSSILFRIFRGEFGEKWTHPTYAEKPSWLYCTEYPNHSSSYKSIVWYNYWTGADPMGTHFAGNAAAHTIEEMIDIIANSMARGPLSQQVPDGSTPVYVVNATEYNGTLNAPGLGTINYKDIYDRLAAILGRDSENKYRVWVSTSAHAYPNCSSGDAIVDASSPTVVIVNPTIGSYVNTEVIKVEGTASDDVQLHYIELSVNGGATWKRASGTATWSCDVVFPSPGTYTIKARATDNYGRTAEVSRSVIYDNTACVINIGEPTAGSSFPCSAIRVAGTASDDQGVANVKVRVNGGPWIETGQTLIWGSNINLRTGANLITAQATDVSGNISTASVNVTRAGTPQADVNIPNNWSFPALHVDKCPSSNSTSAVYDLGSTRNYTVIANRTVSISHYPQCPLPLYGDFGLTLQSSYDNVDANFVSILGASNTIRTTLNPVSGSVTGSFYGRYLRVLGSLSMQQNGTCAGCGGQAADGYGVSFTITAGSPCGTPSPTYSVSGTVTLNGSGLSGVTVSTGSVSTTTDASGNYTISELINGSYTVTPSKNGYVFNPASMSVTVSGANVTGKNFTSTTIATPYAGRVNITAPGTNVQLYQINLPLEASTSYTLTFKAYSNTGHDLSVSLFKHVSPYTNYGLNGFVANLGTGWVTFTKTFTTSGFTGTVSDARLTFMLSAYDAAGDQYYFDDVVLTKVPPASNVIVNPGFESGTSPWIFYTNGTGSFTTVTGKGDTISEINMLPGKTELLPSAPNPLRDNATIHYQLAQPAQTTIMIYNIMGQPVKCLVNECLRPGYHSVKWDGKSDNGQKVVAGVYLYRMKAGDYSKTNKLTVLR